MKPLRKFHQHIDPVNVSGTHTRFPHSPFDQGKKYPSDITVINYSQQLRTQEYALWDLVAREDVPEDWAVVKLVSTKLAAHCSASGTGTDYHVSIRPIRWSNTVRDSVGVLFAVDTEMQAQSIGLHSAVAGWSIVVHLLFGSYLLLR